MVEKEALDRVLYFSQRCAVISLLSYSLYSTKYTLSQLPIKMSTIDEEE